MTHPYRIKKWIQFGRKSGNYFQRLVTTLSIADAMAVKMTKRKSKRKNVSLLTRPPFRYKKSVADTEYEDGSAYRITPTEVLKVYKAIQKERTFYANKRV